MPPPLPPHPHPLCLPSLRWRKGTIKIRTQPQCSRRTRKMGRTCLTQRTRRTDRMRVTRGMLKASPIKPPLSGLSTTAGTTWNSLPGVASQGRTSTTLCPHQGMRTTISSPATSPGANPSSVEGFCYSRRARKTKAEIHPSDPECERVHGRSLSSLSVQEEG